jgi:hypothetical protein
MLTTPDHPDFCACASCQAERAPTADPFALKAVGPVRAGQRAAYGTVAPRVREALARDGVVEAHAFAKRTGLGIMAVEQALKNASRAGRCVLAFRGVYARPDVAAAIRAAVKAAVEVAP